MSVMVLLGITEKQYMEEMSPVSVARLLFLENAKSTAQEVKGATAEALSNMRSGQEQIPQVPRKAGVVEGV